VDVSSEWLDARIWPGCAYQRVANTAEGLEELGRFCEAYGVELVVMEATGGYERLAFRLLSMAGIGCAVVNPRMVRRFAEAMGFLEKTDRIDGEVIARFAEAKGVGPEQPPCADQEKLTALVVRLRQLTELKVSQQNQRRLVDEPQVLGGFDELMRFVKAQVRELEMKIAELIHADPLWREFDKAFRQVVAVSDRTIARLLAELPEIGTLTSKEVAKLAGLAPLAKDSGKASGRRSVRGGRAHVRSILYVVADLVRRHNPDFAQVHQCLLAAGKPRKVVRIALARKLLVRLNAKARDVRACHQPA
jgi:transposase